MVLGTVTVLISNTATRCGVTDMYYHLVEYIILSAQEWGVLRIKGCRCRPNSQPQLPARLILSLSLFGKEKAY